MKILVYADNPAKPARYAGIPSVCLFIALALITLSGCSLDPAYKFKVKKLAPYPSEPTRGEVPIYTHPSQLPREYFQIATIKTRHSSEHVDMEEMYEEVREKAREIGADAVVIRTFVSAKGTAVYGYAVVWDRSPDFSSEGIEGE